MKLKCLVMIAVLALTGAASATTCKPARKQLREARSVLRECNKAWSDSIPRDAADPSNDCSSLQAEFVTAVKAMKACLREAKTKKP